jgi:FAD/FMN-containing dehydrogenase
VVDNLLEVRIVMADGNILTASADQNPDLFWAIRGAGHNFGVVTSFKYRLHPLGPIVSGMLIYPRAAAVDLMGTLDEFLRSAPPELYTTYGCLNAPDGAPISAIIPVWPGSLDGGGDVIKEGQDLVKSFCDKMPPLANMTQPMPYTAVQKLADPLAPHGARYYWKASFVGKYSAGLAKVMEEGANGMPSPFSALLLFSMRGAVNKVAKDATAFNHRGYEGEMSYITHWKASEDDQRNIQWANDVHSKAQPYVLPVNYTNHLAAGEGDARVAASYGDNYPKLRTLKKKYDPNNVFKSNNNIPPAAHR